MEAGSRRVIQVRALRSMGLEFLIVTPQIMKRKDLFPRNNLHRPSGPLVATKRRAKSAVKASQTMNSSPFNPATTNSATAASARTSRI